MLRRKVGIPLLLLLAVLVTGCTRTTKTGALDRSGLWGKIVGVVQDTLDYFNHLTHSYGLALLIVTLIVRIIIFPLMVKQIRYQKTMAQLQPELKKIQTKYKDDKQKLQQEQMKLFQQYGANPLSGCFPILIQMPVLYALYGAINTDLQLKASKFLGFSLAVTHSWENIVLAVLAAATTYFSSKMSMTSSDPNARMMMWIAPVMIAIFAYQFPAALGLYWAFSNVLTMIQTYFTKGMRHTPETTAQGGKSK